MLYLLDANVLIAASRYYPLTLSIYYRNIGNGC